MKKNKKIVLCGVQEQGMEIIEHLRKHGIFVTRIVTITEECAKKNNAAGWASYETFAKDHHIPIHYLETYGMKDAKDRQFFKNEGFDLLLLGGWQRLIPDEIFKTLKYGAIGQHGSSEFLPKGRGRSPLNWSVIEGKKRLVWHLFFLTPGIDDGDVVDYEIFEINYWDTIQTLYYKISVAVKHMLSRTIPKIFDGTVTRKPQEGEPTFYPKRTPEDGIIDWQKPMLDIYNLIRAVTHPYPGAFTYNDGVKVVIWKAQPWDTKLTFYQETQPGEIVEVFENNAYVVKCRDGLLLVLESDDKNAKRGKIYK